MGCGSVGDISNVSGSNSVAVPHHGKKSRRGEKEEATDGVIRRNYPWPTT